MPLVQHKVFTENLAAATERWCWHVVLLFFLLCFKNFSVFLQLYIKLYIERKKSVKNQMKGELHCITRGLFGQRVNKLPHAYRTWEQEVASSVPGLSDSFQLLMIVIVTGFIPVS